MSTIADYSVFTKTFLASGMTDFSQLYGKKFQGEGTEGTLRAFAVIPIKLDTPLTPREAMNFDLSKLGLTPASLDLRVSCRDANRNFIGNIVRVQPNERAGSIRLVAKVAVPGLVAKESDNNPADAPYNTFVLVRTDDSTNVDLPIAVATISEGYNLHKHKVVASVNGSPDQFDVNFVDPLDDVENANYVSFTINKLNGYTSVDFNPDAYATYDDVANALSRGIDGLHIAFDTASGDLKLLDKDGNVLDQANLPIKTDVIIADGEEGYKYVKTDVKQDIHAAKAWMPKGSTAWEGVPEAPYTMQHAALVVEKVSSRVFISGKPDVRLPISTQPVVIPHVEIGGSTYMLADSQESTCNLFRVKGDAGIPTYHNVTFSGNKVTITDASTTESASHDVTTSDVKVDVITFENTLYVLGETDNLSEDSRYRALSTNSGVDPYFYGAIETSGGTSTGGVLGIAIKGDGDVKTMYTFDEGAQPHAEITSISGEKVRWLDTKPLTEVPNHTLKYGLEAFVWTVKDRKVKLDEPFFQQLNASLLALGFHEGDDIALGTNLSKLSTALNGVDADEYIHGKNKKAVREQEVDAQRANAKVELVAWNAQHPALTEDREHGTIIDSSGLDVRAGSITLGCGRIGEKDKFQKINYGIRMRERYGVNDQNTYDSLDFTVSHHTGKVQFDENGHAAQPGGNNGLVPLTSSTLLSIEAGSYISGAPTCLILAEVTRHTNGDSPNPPEGGSPNPPEVSPVLTPIRMTAGFSVEAPYSASSGLQLTIHDYRDNIAAVFNPNNYDHIPAIIEVQAIYTHLNAQSETVPAQQMHTYIGEWTTISAEGVHAHPGCSFLCNKIEEWMTAVGLADAKNQGVKLYVVIRVY